jgi:hypothetical protein
VKPCEYCGHALPEGVDKGTRRVRSYHFASCAARIAAHCAPTGRETLASEVVRLRHNVQVLTDALWKACGDDETVVAATIESQGVMK